MTMATDKIRQMQRDLMHINKELVRLLIQQHAIYQQTTDASNPNKALHEEINKLEVARNYLKRAITSLSEIKI